MTTSRLSDLLTAAGLTPAARDSSRNARDDAVRTAVDPWAVGRALGRDAERAANARLVRAREDLARLRAAHARLVARGQAADRAARLVVRAERVLRQAEDAVRRERKCADERAAQEVAAATGGRQAARLRDSAAQGYNLAVSYARIAPAPGDLRAAAEGLVLFAPRLVREVNRPAVRLVEVVARDAAARAAARQARIEREAEDLHLARTGRP